VHEAEKMAREKGITAAQLALAWVLAQGDHIVPIPGTRSIKRLEENAAATEIRLTRSDLDRLDTIIPRGAAAGDRYPEAGMRTVGR
jgi:aryl-alcohol dehydrogenase-like predicted oxidoreductase